MSVRILGYVMARDEWPLLGLAVVHALSIGVEQVVVVDHASRDSTASELPRLQAAWPGRITVLRLHDETFLQESTTAVVMQAVAAAEYDWVYVFDADEFLLTGPDCDLAGLLQAVPEEVGAVRYEVQNWIAPYDMDDSDPGQYSRITTRAVPCIFTNVPSGVMASDIERGDASLFDVAFGSKIIVRAVHADALCAGAHHMHSERPVLEEPVDPDRLRAGHLLLLSWPRLGLRSRQGQALIDAGFPASHGWQSQMVRRIELDGNLKQFWAAHSIPAAVVDPVSSSSPVTVDDQALSVALVQAGTRLASTEEVAIPEADLPSSPTVDLDRLIAMRHLLASERDRARDDRPQCGGGGSGADSAACRLSSRLQSVTDELLTTEMARLDTERELNAVLRSRSWRWTRLLRR